MSPFLARLGTSTRTNLCLLIPRLGEVQQRHLAALARRRPQALLRGPGVDRQRRPRRRRGGGCLRRHLTDRAHDGSRRYLLRKSGLRWDFCAPLAAVSDRKGVVQWHHWLVHQPAPPPPPGGRPREALFGRWHHNPQQVDRWDIGGIATDGDMCKFENGVSLSFEALAGPMLTRSWRVGVRREALQRTAVAAPGKPLTCERLCSNGPGTCMNLCFILFLHNVFLHA